MCSISNSFIVLLSIAYGWLILTENEQLRYKVIQFVGDFKIKRVIVSKIIL
jgi:hypothetical protein